MIALRRSKVQTQRGVLTGKSPAIQLNVNATRMSEAFAGSSYIQQMVLGEVKEFVQRYCGSVAPSVDLALRACFNPNLEQSWFGALMKIINNVTIHHPQNRLKAYVEFSERAKEKPLSYSTIEKAFFSTFIRKDPLVTPVNLRLEIGENPRDLEKQQLVELMNIIAEKIFEGQYDFDLGTDKVEEKIREGENIPDGHLRATRISREEVVYNWVLYVHNLLRLYYLMRGEIIKDDELFEHKFSSELWGLIRKLIKNLAALSLWVNHSLCNRVWGQAELRFVESQTHGLWGSTGGGLDHG